jgi:hypothetical protein
MRKRLTALILLTILILPLFTQAMEAYSIKDIRQQAAQGWKGSYKAHGREIAVDVMPQIPVVDAVPVLRVQHLEVPVSLPANDPLWHPVRDDGPGEFLVQRSAPGQEPAGALHVGGENISAKGWRVWYEGFAPELMPLSGNPITFGEIASWLGGTLVSLGLDPGIIQLSQPEDIQSHAYYGAKEGEYLAPGWASFHWQQIISGIPVVGIFHRAFFESHFEGGTRTDISLVYRQPDNFWLGVHLVQPVETIAEDLPLAAFSQLHIKLGYALFEAPGYTSKQVTDKTRSFYAFPIWSIGSIYVSDPKKAAAPVYVDHIDPYFYDPHNSLAYREIMVNAQTGQLINPQSRKVDAIIYPGIKH